MVIKAPYATIDKSTILHCGIHNPPYQYCLQGNVLKSTETGRDLGILRVSSGSYDQQIIKVSTKPTRLSGAIMCAFHDSVYIDVDIQYLCLTNFDIYLTNMKSLMCTQ